MSAGDPTVVRLGSGPLSGGRMAHSYGYAPARRVVLVEGERPLPPGGQEALVRYVLTLTQGYRSGGAFSGSGVTRH